MVLRQRWTEGWIVGICVVSAVDLLAFDVVLKQGTEDEEQEDSEREASAPSRQVKLKLLSGIKLCSSCTRAMQDKDCARVQHERDGHALSALLLVACHFETPTAMTMRG